MMISVKNEVCACDKLLVPARGLNLRSIQTKNSSVYENAMTGL